LLSVSGAHAAAPPVDASALLQQYEPVLYFQPQEAWAPETVDRFLSEARLEQQTAAGKWTTIQPPLPTSTNGCSLSPCYRLDLPCPLSSGVACYEHERSTTADWQHPSVYARLVAVPSGTPPPAGLPAPRYLLRYWLFYRFDDWHSLKKRLWQAHEGDWESITVALSATQQPLFAAYSEHCSGTVHAWAGVRKRAGTHPVAYVALGSHANYFTSAQTGARLTDCLRSYASSSRLAAAERIVSLTGDRVVDQMGTAHPAGPADLPGVAPLELVQLTLPLPDWARFPGRWSEGQLLWLGSTPRPFTSVSEGRGPATPNWVGVSIPSGWHASSS
jgi:hypothetical protein